MSELNKKNDKLISMMAAIDAMAKFVPYAIDDDVTRAYTDGLTDAYNLVCQLPSAQPVIRCKDCKHFGGGTYCHERDGMWDENDFCSYAERKEQDDG